MLKDRKDEHLSVVLNDLQKGSTKTTGFESIDFVHCALPEMHLDDVDLHTTFLGKRISAPLLVSSMTGGPERAAFINENLARACEAMSRSRRMAGADLAESSGRWPLPSPFSAISGQHSSTGDSASTRPNAASR
jgi:isopentenyl-diphosphate delta-isomerase